MTQHVSVSRWDVASVVTRCHGCPNSIIAGEAVRLVGPSRWPFCRQCAKARFDMDAPDHVPAQPKARFTFATAKDLAQDFKRAQGKDGE